jgi:four helix bundle protein
VRNFEELQVGKKAHLLTLAIYEVTRSFPRDEQFGLTGQIRRAACSVGSNIAEGAGRDSDADFARFLQMAAGSVSEVEYQLLLARDLGYLDALRHDELKAAAQEVRRMLYGFIEYLRRKSP